MSVAPPPIVTSAQSAIGQPRNGAPLYLIVKLLKTRRVTGVGMLALQP